VKNFFKILLTVILSLGIVSTAKASFASSASESSSSANGNSASSFASTTGSASASASAESSSVALTISSSSSSQADFDSSDDSLEQFVYPPAKQVGEESVVSTVGEQLSDPIDISALNLELSDLDQKISTNKQEIDKASQVGKKSLVVLGVMSALELVMIVLLVLILIKRRASLKGPQNISNFLV